MIVVCTILILLFSFLIWLLITPIRLIIDSSQNKYFIQWIGLGRIALIATKEEWFFRLKIGFWKKKIGFQSIVDEWTKEDKTKEDKKIPTTNKKKKKSSFFKSMEKVRQVLKSFNVKTFKVDIDTDNYYLNALLIPAFQVLNKNNQHRIAINFRNQNNVLVNIENRLIKIIYSILAKS